jgi:hypothetical protein
MTTDQLRRRIVQRIRRLSPERLRVADDFVAYLQERGKDSETAELLAIPGFRAALRRAEREAAAGKGVPFAKVRRDV